MRNSLNHLICALLLVLSGQGALHAQDSTENYIRQTVFLDSAGTQGVSTVQYYDGLGRPVQKSEGGYVTGNADGRTHYLHTVQEYDAAGRESTAWLPMYSGGSLPGILTESDIVTFSSTSYRQDSHAYSTTSRDALGRPLFVSAPGDTWSQGGKGRATAYRGNHDGEVRLYRIADGQLTADSCYRRNTLYCTESTDEDGIRVTTFRDNRDRTVLERRGEDETLDTYYVYDERGLLRYVLPPKYQTQPSLDDLAFCYEYDSRGRTVGSKMPGCEWKRHCYNSADQLCYEQDGEMAARGIFRFYLYDRLGRMVVQGTCSSEPLALKTGVHAVSFEEEGDNELLSTGYCLTAPLTLASAALEVVNYYDDYRFLSKFEGSISDSVGIMTQMAQNRRGLLTGTLHKTSSATPSGSLAEDSQLTVNCYDRKSRLSASVLYAFGRHATVTRNEYTYCGDLSSTTQSYYRLAGSGMEPTGTVTVDCDYYEGTRMLKRTRTSYASPSQNLVLEDMTCTYDTLGHVIGKDRKGTGADMSYTYSLLTGAVSGIASEGGFTQSLFRETGTSAPRFNGSISAMTWKIPGGNPIRRYDYTYDVFNRLTNADYSNLRDAEPFVLGPIFSPLGLIPSHNLDSVPDLSVIEFVIDLYGEEIAYDENSNITSLRRMGATDTRRYGLIDDLSITYRGNQRVAVQDEAGTLSYSGASDFADGEDSEEEYAYNANGALTMDFNRGITDIEYDNFGNPRMITFMDSRSIEYVYSSDGTRLRTIHKMPGLTAWTHYGGAVVLTWRRDTTDYIGNLIVKNGHPEMLRFDGGYASFSNDTIDGLHYYIQDYQGNNRMVVNKDGAIEQVTHYYPYGGVIGDISTNESLQKYKFEGKELDRTFGLDNYDIQARQYFAMAPMWDRIDPLATKSPGISPYAFCEGNPVNKGDYNGKLTIFINGQQLGNGGSSEYWDGVDKKIMDLTNDYNVRYLDGSCGGWINTMLVGYDENGRDWNNLSSQARIANGYQRGEQMAEYIYANLSEDETIKVVTHSMGGAYGKGFVQSLVDYANNNDIESKIEFELDLAPFQPTEQRAVEGVPTYQASHTNDIIATGEIIPGISKSSINPYKFTKTSTSPLKNYVLIPHAVKSFTSEIIKLLKK